MGALEDHPATLEAGRAALDACDWSAAATELESLVTTRPDEEARRLDSLADAYWWLSRLDDCIDARRQAYALFEELGDTRRTGQTAVWLYEHHCFKGQPAIGSAWLQRARRALEDDSECTAWGNLLLREAEAAHGAGDLVIAADKAQAALGLARRLREASLEGEALQTIGRILIDDRRPADGLAHLDEAMLLAVEGRLSPYATGKVYCSMVGACEDLGDLRRAAEWTEATSRWAQGHPFAVFPGLCRVKRAGVLQRQGQFQQAEHEARLACEELATVKVGSAAAAWSEVGEIRRRIGDLHGAEEAFRRTEELCCTPSAGLALLRLAQGRSEEASAIVDGALRDQAWSSLARARLLPAKVEVAVAVGAVESARDAADELTSIAADYDSASLRASADTARGRVGLASADVVAAGQVLRRAVKGWHDLEVPYEEATAQLLLAAVLDLSGERDAAARTRSAAIATLARLGAAYDARWTASGRPPALPCGLTEREAEVLRLVASGRTNKEIAAELVLSDKTVARHLSNIFTKVGVATRSAATAFAFETGIVASAP